MQLSVTICSDTVKEIAENIIGNLDENGIFTASNEIFCRAKNIPDDVDDALAVVARLDPIGIGARDLRECLLLQLKPSTLRNTLA